ncbi:MAG: DUF4494 domain-containing protein [Prolixibacteraceae bacterium]|nr:DUF4494 domain-containing protein [Prolixibacteraceae bacterium]MBN2649567.1 DUF4494 domain-containing protein [Prolixibacteraceae bacterium]
MQTWYECKVKYLKIDQSGHERKVNDNYLLDAVSFTDAETRIYKEMQQLTNGEFQVVNIKKSNISEVIPSESGEWWYKAKINLITIDEEAGKEKKVTNYILVMADDINHALKRVEEGLSYMLVPYVVTSIQLSAIAEVFPYDEELQPKEIERKPISKTNPTPVAPETELEDHAYKYQQDSDETENDDELEDLDETIDN